MVAPYGRACGLGGERVGYGTEELGRAVRVALGVVRGAPGRGGGVVRPTLRGGAVGGGKGFGCGTGPGSAPGPRVLRTEPCTVSRGSLKSLLAQALAGDWPRA